MLTRKPYKGETVRWPHSGYTATVMRTPEGDDNLCWIQGPKDRDAAPFIWRFRDGLNQMAEIVEPGQAATGVVAVNARWEGR